MLYVFSSSLLIVDSILICRWPSSAETCRHRRTNKLHYLDSCVLTDLPSLISTGLTAYQSFPTYFISRWSLKCRKKLFFFCHLLEWTVLNSFIINTTCGSLTIQTDMLRDLIQEMGRVSRTQSKRQAPSVSQLKRLDTIHSKHWPLKWKRIVCCAFSKKKETRRKFECSDCSVGLYACAKLEKQSMPTEVNITTVITELVFYGTISWWIVGGESGVGLQKASWKNRDLLERPLFVYFSFFLWEKRKYECLLGDICK